MDDYLSEAEIAPSARKHGIADEDIRHALRHYWAIHSTDDLRMVIHVGSSTTGEPLEILVVYSDTDVLIIHAMTARRKYLP